MPSAYRLGFAAFIPLGSQSSDSQTGGALLIDPTGGGFQSEGDATTPFVGRVTRAPLVVPLLDANGDPVIENGVPQTISFARDTAVVVAGQREVVSKVLMRPSLLLTNGEQREVFVGNSIPIPVQRTESGATNPLIVSQSARHGRRGLERFVLPKPVVPSEENGLHGCVVY